MLKAQIILTFAAACGCGLVAGVFFAFSSFVMKALAKLPAAQGVAAMQSINVAVINKSFMMLLFGTAALCVAVAAMAAIGWPRPGLGWGVAGAMVYLLGTIGTTIVFNVPHNNVLATVDPADANAAEVWANYVTQWTAWNHVRAAAAAVAMGLLIWSLCATWSSRHA